MKNVFLHGDLPEEVHVEVTFGLKEKFEKDSVHAEGGSYRLKQSSRAWFGRLKEAI